jgi:hypothetical protein
VCAHATGVIETEHIPSNCLDLDFLITELQPPVASALHQSAATEQMISERREHLSQMTDRPDEDGA